MVSKYLGEPLFEGVAVRKSDCCLIQKNALGYRNALFVCMLTLFAGCTVRQTDGKDMGNDSIEYLGGRTSVSQGDALRQYFFCSPAGDTVYVSHDALLRELYENKYQTAYESFDAFLQTLLAGKFHGTLCEDSVNYVYYDGSFEIEESIIEYYRQNGIERLKKKYLTYRDGELTFKPSCKGDMMGSIAYCMWQNGYEYVFNTVGGGSYFVKERKSR